VGVLIAIGVVLWFINRLYVGRVKELDATQIT
jgi:hypothetical protein